LTGCSKLKNGYTTAMELLREIKDQNLGMDGVIYGTLLAICASNNLRREAELYFQQMKDEGHHPNLFHYSSLLNLHAEDRDHTEAEILVNEMKSLGIAPNKVYVLIYCLFFLLHLFKILPHIIEE
jgi:pentatricopeptide repeat protein